MQRHPRTRHLSRALLFAATFLTLAACGGGGGGGGEDDTTPPPADTTAPSASIAAPAPGFTTEAETITVSGTATDAGEITALTVNGVNATTSDGFANWSADVPLNIGSNTLTVATADSAGNEDPAAAQRVVHRLDVTPPSASIVSPSANTSLGAESLVVEGTATDESPIAAVTVNGMAATTSDGFATWTATVPLEIGTNILTVTTTDTAGNTEPAAAQMTVTRLDVEPPSVAIVAPDANAALEADSVTVEGTAADTSAIAAVSVNGVAATTSDGFSTWRVTVPLDVGTNTLTVTASDSAGNTAPDAARMTVERMASAPPAATVTSPADGITTEVGSITVEGTAADDSEITAVTVNGVDASSSDGFSTWTATVPLNLGTNTLTVATADEVGNTSANAAEITVERAASAPPTAYITSPADGTTTEASSITVEGTAADDSEITAVTIDGVDASSSDGFATWTATVPLDLGSNTLNVATEDALGNSDTNAAQIGIERLVDDTPPTANIVFPPAQSSTDAERITVRGTASDANEITLVRVNGIDATTTDGFATWSVSVPLNEGDNTLSVETGDIALNTDSTADEAAIERAIPWAYPRAVTIDGGSNRALVIDGRLDRLFAVDLASGDRTVLSDSSTSYGTGLSGALSIAVDETGGRAIISSTRNRYGLIAVDLSTGERTQLSGDGPNFRRPQALTVDETNNRALVVDNSLDALFAVDLATGNRTVLSDGSTGAGTPFDYLYSVAINDTGSEAFVGGNGGIFSVDLTTGDRAILSDYDTGTGPRVGTVSSLVFDGVNNRLLSVNGSYSGGGLLAVDLATGNRSIVTDASTGSGPELASPISVALDAINNRALLVDYRAVALFDVDLTNGDRTVLSGSSIASGTDFQTPRSVVLDRPNNRVLIAGDTNPGTLFAVALADGQRTALSDGSVGSGTRINHIDALALDSSNGRALVGNSRDGALYSVQLATGERAPLSDASTGSGPAFESPISMIVADAGDTALVLDRDLRALFSVNLSTGDRTIVSDATTGAGAPFSYPASFALDGEENRVIVSDRSESALFTVDLSTGDRTVLSGSSTGSGTPLVTPNAVALDDAGNRAWVLDASQTALLSVDLATGHRTVVSDASIGSGVTLEYTTSLALSPDASVILVTSGLFDALLAVDLTTGDRVLLSK